MWANPPGRTEFSAQVRTCPMGVCCECELAVWEAASRAWMEASAPSEMGLHSTELDGESSDMKAE